MLVRHLITCAGSDKLTLDTVTMYRKASLSNFWPCANLSLFATIASFYHQFSVCLHRNSLLSTFSCHYSQSIILKVWFLAYKKLCLWGQDNYYDLESTDTSEYNVWWLLHAFIIKYYEDCDWTRWVGLACF